MERCWKDNPKVGFCKFVLKAYLCSYILSIVLELQEQPSFQEILKILDQKGTAYMERMHTRITGKAESD